MDDSFLTKRVLFIPLVLVVLLFLADKLLGLESVRKYTETRIEQAFYEEKNAVLSYYEKKYLESKSDPEKKNNFLLLFGTSHMGEFSDAYIKKKTGSFSTFNFSAPLAPPSFLYYYFEKILNKKIIPDYVVLEIVPENMQVYSNEYALKYSYDLRYIWENKGNFSGPEIESFLSANLFYSIRYPFRFGTMLSRIKNPAALGQFEYMRQVIRQATLENNGGIPNPIIHEVPEDHFEKEASEYYEKFLKNFSISQTQKRFLEKFLQTARDHQVKLVVYMPFVCEPLQKKMDASEKIQTWKKDISALVKKYNAELFDLSVRRENFQCRKFLDTHHLSGGCYPELTDSLLKSIF